MEQYIDPYEQCIQYPTVKDGIKAHAEVYSFNIESELFNQLTKEQQKLWRKEIEQACISGGDAGYLLARDPRYKENLEVKEVSLDFMLHEYWKLSPKITIDCLESATMTKDEMIEFARHFFELGMAASNNAQKGE